MQDHNLSAAASRRAELGAFLRAQRAGVQPVDVGLPPGSGRRRTPGLRREEIAQLAGIGLTWYTWLEQGRDMPASQQVIDALARALRMDSDQHRHLRALAALPAPGAPPSKSGLLPRWQRFVDAAAPNIASVYDAHFDYLTWNRPYTLVRHDPSELPGDRRNLLWWIFTDPVCRSRLPAWEGIARALIGQFRTAAGQHSNDPRFIELVDALTETSSMFTDWWAEYPVRGFAPATIEVNHPATGPIDLELFQFRPVDAPGLVAVVQAPANVKSRERIDSILR